ncbi:MAG: BREX-1 system phosphatase PglZ type B, partial [Dehalococcoidia bacterium]|nr:BREX-1 system phosphatase PglZ type B [Dehalococcoidia bacterium]
AGQGGLEPAITATGARLTTEGLRRVLEGQGYQILRGDETGDPSGCAWTESGAIDSYGHQHGWKIAHHVRAELRALERRIVALLDAGWQQVQVVTDHGWLMLPDGLPKAELPEHLTVVRKGRCARLKELAQTDQQIVFWHWDPSVRIAVAPNICCYEAGKEYEHGGLSPQECVVPVINVTRGESVRRDVVIQRVIWRGLRCVVNVSGTQAGDRVDLRGRAADPGSSLAAEVRSPNPDGSVSLIVPDDEREGEAALVVVLAADGNVLAQAATVIGG